MEWTTGMVEWNSGMVWAPGSRRSGNDPVDKINRFLSHLAFHRMDYWNGGMLHRTYLIIQHVLYSGRYPHQRNTRVCHGCRQKYSKPALPPHNLCVRHKEWQSFGPMDNRQTRFENVYFHCNLPCVKAVCRPSNSPAFRGCHPDFVKITRSPGRVVNHPHYSGKI